MTPLRRLASLVVVLLPWQLKRWALTRWWRYDIAPDARIGLSYIFPAQLTMEEGAYIGHLNVAINIDRMECGPHSGISRSNWITGHPPDGDQFTHRTDRDPSLELGAHAAVTKSHLIDCTDKVSIGAFTTIAGYRTQIITHGIDVGESRQDCRPIWIGSYTLIGTRSVLLGGSRIPDRCVLAAGSVLAAALDEAHSLYGGQPARKIKDLDPDSRYFQRVDGYVR